MRYAGKITIDKSGAYTAAIEEYNTDIEASIELRQVVPEQCRGARPPPDQTNDPPDARLQSFWSAAITLAGTELMHMIRKGQLQSCAGGLTPAAQFYWLYTDVPNEKA